MSSGNPGNQDQGAHLSRRAFVQRGGLGIAGMSLAFHDPDAIPSPPLSSNERAVILLLLVGGPSQFESFDPKPDAPANIRGPFGSIPTSVPGIRVVEHLPGLARRMDRLTLIRSLHHEEAPIHETGLQLVQTGRLARPGEVFPHFGAVASRHLPGVNEAAPFVLLPGRIEHTGVRISNGQDAGQLGHHLQPFTNPMDVDDEPARIREAYGPSEFGRCCLAARRAVEAGSRVIVVNMYRTVFEGPSWDSHGRHPFATTSDLRDVVLPDFDRGLSALLDDLQRRGRLNSTLVAATGEFGRSPHLNESGGRDHWPRAWSALLAGGGTTGGGVIGATDSLGGETVERPVHPAELVATFYDFLGIDPKRLISHGGHAPTFLLGDHRPIFDAFG